MWYRKLLETLASTICCTHHDEAVLYVNKLLDALIKELYSGDEPEPTMIFGLIVQLCRLYRIEHHFETTSLENFAQLSFGLAILYSKYADDHRIFCSNFMDVVLNHKLYDFLNFNQMYQDIYKELLEGRRVHTLITPIAMIKNEDELKENDEYLLAITLTEVIKKLEVMAFKRINYELHTDLSEFIVVFNFLLKKQEDQLAILEDLLRYLTPYKNKNKNDKFDYFILSLEENVFKLTNQGRLIQIKEIKKEFELYEASTSDIWSVTHDDLLLNQLKGDEDKEDEPQWIEQLNSIIELLEKYIKQNLSYFFGFFGKGNSESTKEVEKICTQIKYGQYKEIQPLLDDLSAIKINQKNDQWSELRELIIKKCRTAEQVSDDMIKPSVNGIASDSSIV